MASEGDYVKDSTFSSLPRTTRGLPLVISGSPDGKKFVYCNGNSVYIRNVENILDCDIYTEHATLTTVGKMSPSGFYIASGDQSGKIRIWDTTQSTHILKGEYAIISGPIRDISWSDDSKRLAVVGEGRERFGHVFLFDTGTSNGNLSGQSRPMSSIDFKPTRPYRLVSGSEDYTVALFEGPPFKFKTLFHEHTRFVHCVRYNKDGSLFASAGADGKVNIFEGAEGEKIGELIDSSINNGVAHGGGVFGLAWDGQGKRLVTVSGDKTLKIWNVADKQLLSTLTFGTTIEDQQLSVAWLNDVIISVSLAGFFYYVDPEKCSINKVLKGHNKPITAMAISNHKKLAFTADFEGNITRWELATGISERISPMVHKSQVAGLCLADNGTLVSVGWDDKIAFTKNTFDNIVEVSSSSCIHQKLSSQPRGVACLPNLKKVVVACQKSIYVFGGDNDEKPAFELNIKFEGLCVDINLSGTIVAVGGHDSRVRIYDLDSSNNTLIEKKLLQHQGAVSSLKFSPDEKYLVATDITRKVIPYSVENDYKIASDKEWSFHTARINCCAWSPDSRYIATGSLDTNIIVWDMKRSGEHPIIIKGAHSMSSINDIAWISPNRLLSTGQDSNIKQWTIKI